MKKPKQKKLQYYDWDSVKSYLVENKIWSKSFASNFWSELCEEKEIRNGSPFTITDWEFKHDNGRFMYMLSDTMTQGVPDLLKHFGQPDTKCLDSGVLTATFIATW